MRTVNRLVGGGRLRHSSGAMAALRVALDLTTLGLKSSESWPDVFQVRFVEALIRHLPSVEFVMLTGADGHGPLAHLEGANARRCVVPDPSPLEVAVTRLDARLPGRSRRARLAHKLGSMRRLGPVLARWRPGLLSKLRVDVVFCPFTDSGMHDTSAPLVAAVHDLRHVSHPYLLGSAARAARERAFVATSRRAAAIVCSTPSVRDVALQHARLSSEQVLSLAPGRLMTARPQADAAIAATLARHNLAHTGFVLVAADLEPRHNLRTALTALAMVRARHPASELRLVCVGGSAAKRASMTATANQMGLGSVARFIGPLGRDETLALIQASRAVLEPALYETVGETVLQAMHVGCPVLCSRIPGLIELTGSAALSFDPYQPADLAAAFERIGCEPRLLESLAAAGHQRIARLESPESVAGAYLDVFRKARTACPASR